jgi:hypothetical protein
MKNYGIKLVLFLIAFTLGTTAAILFWREGNSQKPISPSAASMPDNNSTQTQFSESSLVNSLSFDGETSGCGNFIVYKSTIDKTKVVVVSVNKKELKLSQKPKTFNLANNKNIKVIIYDFGKDTYEWSEKLCYDLIDAKNPIETVASSGNVTISLANPWRSTYSVKVLLNNISFRISEENIFVLKNLEINVHHVGLAMG